MKKLLLSVTALALQAASFAQAVPNGGFENWNTITYEEPVSWITGNERNIPKMGVSAITKVTGVSGFAIRIENKVIGTDTSESYIIDTQNPCTDPPLWTGGVPYSQQPTAITGSYRYSLLGNDSALLFVIFRKNGVHIGDNFIMIRGTGSQPTFTSFSFPVTCSGVPDSVIIAAASSNSKGGGFHAGSFIELDNLAFSGASQAIPGGNFDSWITKNFDKPIGWEQWGTGVSKTTSMYAGAFAVRIETVNQTCGGNNPSSGITNGHNTNNSGPRGGQPYTNVNDTVCGYYKYTSVGNDTASISVSLTKSTVGVGGNFRKLTAAAAYTYFEFPIQAGIAPDTMLVQVQSSKWPSTLANIGSVLYLDNLYLKSTLTGISGKENVVQNSVYPNPVKDVLFIRTGNLFTDVTRADIYDASGRKVDTKDLAKSANALSLDVSNLQPGIYLTEIKTTGGIMRSRFVKE